MLFELVIGSDIRTWMGELSEVVSISIVSPLSGFLFSLVRSPNLEAVGTLALPAHQNVLKRPSRRCGNSLLGVTNGDNKVGIAGTALRTPAIKLRR